MKSSHTANIAIALLAIGWLIGAYGVLSQLGDPAPWVLRADLEAHRRVSLSLMFVGLLALLASVWLSGYSFVSAPRRATLAILGSVVPVILLFASALH